MNNSAIVYFVLFIKLIAAINPNVPINFHMGLSDVLDWMLPYSSKHFYHAIEISNNIFFIAGPQQNSFYDFIIIGAGPAGCVLANRLSENPKWSVYLIEAGKPENIVHKIPTTAAFLQNTVSNWGYKTVPQKYACFGMRNNECALPRGRSLGGSSSINYMIYSRGNRRDFDRWEKAGAKGWSYADVMPYFLKSERANLKGLESSPYHNRSGLVNVEDVQFRTQFAHSFVDGAQEAGHRLTDYNGKSQLGVSYVQATTMNGRRYSAATAYIKPIAKARKNLHIITSAKVTQILIDPKTNTAFGVQFLHRRILYNIMARKEVILSAGVFNSPQLLMLSGIGPADNLKAIGVQIKKELPVGKILYDHMCHFGPTFVTNTTGQTIYAKRIDFGDIRAFRSGDSSSVLSSIGGVESLTFIKVPQSKQPKDLPDIEILTVAGSLASDEGPGSKEGANFKDDLYDILYQPLVKNLQEHFSVIIMQLHPKSFGRLWLHSRNPNEAPKINPNYFENDKDIEFLLEGIKESIRISQTSTMQKIGTRLHRVPVPGCEELPFASDDYWRCSIRTMSYTLHHQIGTCRMGSESDPTTVVNSQLKVHGIGRLRVVDTSIIPFPPSGHTMALSYMIGEKAADMIRGDWNTS